MKGLQPGLAALLLLLAGCATTGDPRAGGLFGWSEGKARRRQTERQAAAGAAESELSREQGRSGELRSREAVTRRRFAAASARADDERARSAAHLRQRESAVRAKAIRLEEESATAATASRARQLRAALDRLVADRTLGAADHQRQLAALEVEIDEARRDLER